MSREMSHFWLRARSRRSLTKEDSKRSLTICIKLTIVTQTLTVHFSAAFCLLWSVRTSEPPTLLGFAFQLFEMDQSLAILKCKTK